MRSLRYSMAALAFGVLIAGPGAAADLDRLSADELLPMAKKEGEVVVYSFTSRIKKVEKAFEAAYPAVDLVGYDISSTKQIARLLSEKQAGVVNADVIYISDAPVVFDKLIAAGIMTAYVPPRVADRVPAEFRSPVLAQRLSTKVLMYNEEANPGGAPVDNLWELTTAAWKGRVVMVDPLQRGDYLDLLTEIVLRSSDMERAYQAQFGKPIKLASGLNSAGEQFIADLLANDVVLVNSTDDVNAAVGKTGQANPPIGFTSYSDRRDNEEEGWALQLANAVEPAPGIVFPALVGIADGTKHPAAARLVIDFLMGDESPTGGAGFKPFYVPGDYATRTDIVPHPDAVPLGEFRAWRVSPAKTAKIRQEVADLVLTLQ